MAVTITFTARAGNHNYTPVELNALFAHIKTIVDGKLDRRGDTVAADLTMTAAGSVINVKPAEASGDVMQLQQV